MFKRIKLFILLILTLGFATTGLLGCSVVDAGTINDLAGTYKLNVLKRTYSATADSKQREENLIKDKNMTVYLVIGKDGKGFYVYQDNETPLKCLAVDFTFSYETNNDKLIHWVNFKDGKGTSYTGLGFNKKKKMLSVTLPAINGKFIKREYTEYTEYKKVSKATDLSYVESKLGKLDYAPQNLYAMQGTYYLQFASDLASTVGKNYLCCYMYYDAVKNTSKVVYVEKDELTAKTVMYDVETEVSDTVLYPKFKMGDMEYDICPDGYRQPYLSLYVTVPGFEYESEIKWYHLTDVDDTDGNAAFDIEHYNEEETL